MLYKNLYTVLCVALTTIGSSLQRLSVDNQHRDKYVNRI